MDRRRRCAQLISAVRRRDYSTIRSLLTGGLSVDEQDDQGKTAIHYAAQSGFCVDILLKFKPNVNLKDLDGNRPLVLACAEGRCRIIKLLCAAGADVNAVSALNAMLPIIILAQKGHEECVEVLVKHGAIINSPKQWLDVYMAAETYNRYEVIKYLVGLAGGDVLNNPEVSKHLISAATPPYKLEVLVILLALGYRRDCLKKHVYVDSLKCCLSTPPSLKQLSRLAIRERLASPIFEGVYKELRLPSTLGPYLVLNYDIKDECHSPQ